MECDVSKIWDIAKKLDMEYSAMSWGGFDLLGDRKSINEVSRLQHCEDRMKALEVIVKDERERAETLEKTMVSALRAAWHELNTIRARDGVAYHQAYPFHGGTPYCTEEAWDELTKRCAAAVEASTGEPPKPWPFAWEVVK